MEFNISWLRGHPVLKVGDLKIEASHSLGLLLDQLRFPTVKSLSNSVIIVLIKRYFIYPLMPLICCSSIKEARNLKSHMILCSNPGDTCI